MIKIALTTSKNIFYTNIRVNSYSLTKVKVISHATNYLIEYGINDTKFETNKNIDSKTSNHNTSVDMLPFRHTRFYRSKQKALGFSNSFVMLSISGSCDTDRLKAEGFVLVVWF